ncbi:rubredoxin [Dissulfurispira thermophila]|uniref:Rubredoxin n=2 Tax=root TaxID=1 RepID=A0A7G1H2K2_9BACT|nr:rubredoxin [Dissulfurispira thermophila]BCB97010.1 rubredoxin [Dissulfurispira thermophila]
MTEITQKTKEYVCQLCGYIYNPQKGDKKNKIPPGIPFEELPDDYTCPLCGAIKARFAPMLD